jgi:phosphohistidine phosphatase
MARRTLWLLRHATTEDARPGHKDADRRLTAEGEGQAQQVGEYLRGQGGRIDAVLCSSALRARQTLDLLGISAATTDIAVRYYTAGTDTLIEALRSLPDEVTTALLVAHAPALPGVAHELADQTSSDPAALAAIDGRFPAAAIAHLDFDGRWADLDSAALVDVRLPAAG